MVSYFNGFELKEKELLKKNISCLRNKMVKKFLLQMVPKSNHSPTVLGMCSCGLNLAVQIESRMLSSSWSTLL